MLDLLSMCNDLLSNYLAWQGLHSEILDPKCDLHTCIMFVVPSICDIQHTIAISQMERRFLRQRILYHLEPMCVAASQQHYTSCLYGKFTHWANGLVVDIRSFIFTLNTLPAWTFLPSDTGFGITNKFSVTLLAMRRFRPPWFVAWTWWVGIFMLFRMIRFHVFLRPNCTC